jgi:citrate lyase beta subunit
MIVDWIKPDHWNKRFQDSAADVAWARQILEAAGL